MTDELIAEAMARSAAATRKAMAPPPGGRPRSRASMQAEALLRQGVCRLTARRETGLSRWQVRRLDMQIAGGQR